MPTGRQIAGLAGLAALGVAAGLAIEEAVIGRRVRADPNAHEPFGLLHGEPVEVMSVDGIRLYAEVDEPLDCPYDDGLTLIFSHGYALNQDTWHYQRRDLRSLGRMVFWDHRAHGKSGRGHPELTTVDQLGLDLGCVVDALGGRGPVVLVGHSMGGMTVMALAAHRPDLFAPIGPVKGVALLATSAGNMASSTYGLPKVVGQTAYRLAPEVLTRLTGSADLIDKNRARGSDLAFLLTKYYSFGSNVSPAVTNFTAEMINGTPIDVVAEFLPGIDAHEKHDALATMADCESLVMVGDKDRMTPLAYSNEIVRRMPHSETVLLPDTGHMLMLERYAEVNQALTDLAARVRRALAQDSTDPGAAAVP
ncbi:MAG: alpha/beta hydrolase [Actinomycetes bacterium]